MAAEKKKYCNNSCGCKQKIKRLHCLKSISFCKASFIIFSLTNEQRDVLNSASLGHYLLVSGQARTGKSTLFVLQNEILCKCMFNKKQCNLLIFLFTAATVIAIFFFYIIHKKPLSKAFLKEE